MINQLKTIFKNYDILDRKNYYLLMCNNKQIYIYKTDIEFFYALSNCFVCFISLKFFYINSNKYHFTDNIGMVKYYKKDNNEFDGFCIDMKLSYVLSFLRKKKIKLLKNRND